MSSYSMVLNSDKSPKHFLHKVRQTKTGFNITKRNKLLNKTLFQPSLTTRQFQNKSQIKVSSINMFDQSNQQEKYFQTIKTTRSLAENNRKRTLSETDHQESQGLKMGNFTQRNTRISKKKSKLACQLIQELSICRKTIGQRSKKAHKIELGVQSAQVSHEKSRNKKRPPRLVLKKRRVEKKFSILSPW